jgi:two-component system, NarL family, sensor kinase
MQMIPTILLKAATILLLFIYNSSFAQTVPDSLLNKLQLASNDSLKVIALLKIGEAVEIETPEKSLEHYKQALLLSEKIKNNDCVFLCYKNIGNSYIELNKMDSAIVSFEKATNAARLLHDSTLVAKSLGSLGNTYLHKNERVKAMEHYLQAVKILESNQNKKYLPSLYSNINALLDRQKEYGKALEYATKAVVLAQKLADTLLLVDALINQSVSYNHLDKQDTAYTILAHALPFAKKNNDLYQLVTISNNMGDYFLGKKNFEAALLHCLEMYKYAKQMGNKYFITSANIMLAKVYYELKQHDKALTYIKQAENLASEVGERAELKNIYKIRAEIDEATGNYKSATAYYSKTIELRDSLFETETSEKVAEAEAKYQNEKKQKEIVQLQKDKQIQYLSIKQKSTINYFLIASLAALIILGFLGYQNFRNRQQLAKQQGELQQQQINELEKDKQLVAVDSMLQGQEEERSRLAKDLHDGLGGLLSGVKFSLSNMKDNLIITPDNMKVFERSLDMLDTSIKELRRVAHNMMPEILTKFGLDEALKEYCNSINATNLILVKYQSVGMDARIEKSAEIIVYRIIQELLNNIMKHAAATEATVQLVKEDGRLSIIVEDNGKGFDTALMKSNKGAGLISIQSRIDYLKGQLDIHSSPDKGTLVNIELNI